MSRQVRCVVISISLLLIAGLVGGGPAAALANAQAFPDQIDLPDGWSPEGITAGRGSTVYVGSLAGGGIWEGDVRAGTGSVLVPGSTSQVAVGIDYEAGRHRLWVAGGPTGAVRVYDAASGELLASYQVEAGFLNDLVVRRDAVYATDSFLQQLAVIPLGRRGALPLLGDVTTVPLTGDIHFVDDELNANGIVSVGRWLLVVQTNTGQLFRVDPATGAAETVDLGGATVPGGDGLELRGRVLYVARGGSNIVDVFRLSRSARSADLLGSLSDPGLDFPSTAAYTNGRLWVVNARFSTEPTPPDFWITQLPARP